LFGQAGPFFFSAGSGGKKKGGRAPPTAFRFENHYGGEADAPRPENRSQPGRKPGD
jgi:hypothetical protein